MTHWVCIRALYRNKARTALCFDSRSKIYDRSPTAIKPPLSQANPVTLSVYEQINFKHYYDSNRDRTHKIQTPLFYRPLIEHIHKIFYKTFLRLKRRKKLIQNDNVVRVFMCFILSRLYPTLVINKFYQTVMIFLSQRITKIHSYNLYFYGVLLKYFHI